MLGSLKNGQLRTYFILVWKASPSSFGEVSMDSLSPDVSTDESPKLPEDTTAELPSKMVVRDKESLLSDFFPWTDIFAGVPMCLTF